MTVILWLAITLGCSIAAAVFLTPLVIRAAGALKLYDTPDGDRRVHQLPVPRLGGFAVYLAAAAVASIVFVRAAPLFVTPGPPGDAQIRYLAGMFAASALLFITGLVDDVRGLTPAAKAIAQVAAATIAYYAGARLGGIALGYGGGVSVGMLEFPLVLLWIVGVTNAFNFIDGLNGLAGGIAIVATATITIVALALGNFEVLIPTVALGGALLGFLKYNFPSGRIFLGDSGSMSVGFLLAVFSLRAAENGSHAVLVIVPILAMFVPLLDGALAILRRWLRKVPLSGADARHIHHRLLALGLSARRTTLALCALGAGMAGFGLLIALTAPYVAASIALLGLVSLSVLVIYGTNLLSYHELIVAGEVLMTGPGRARRIISDQIQALDVIALINGSDSVEELSSILAEASMQFGFLSMQLCGDSLPADRMTDRVIAAKWAWKLDYPIRVLTRDENEPYVLSIYCSAHQSTRPYGAERVARLLGPALQRWFETHDRGGVDSVAAFPPKIVAEKRRKLRLS